MFKTCGKCDRYSFGLSRCIDGKVNPRTLKGTKEVISIMGLSAICMYSKWRTKAIVQLTIPTSCDELPMNEDAYWLGERQ